MKFVFRKASDLPRENTIVEINTMEELKNLITEHKCFWGSRQCEKLIVDWGEGGFGYETGLPAIILYNDYVE